MYQPARPRVVRAASLLAALAPLVSLVPCAKLPAQQFGMIPASVPAKQRHTLETLIHNLETRTPFRAVAVIDRLPAAYGSFADLNHDGRLDYLSTEMIHARERLSTILRVDNGWQQADEISKPFGARHPMEVWVVENDGSGHPLVLLTTGWAPYMLSFPTDGAGKLLVEQVASLQRKLPQRISKPHGVDNNPYEVLRIEPAIVERGHLRRPARLCGRMVDYTSTRRVSRDWWVELKNGKPGRRFVTCSKPSQGEAWLLEKRELSGWKLPELDAEREKAEPSPLRRAEFHRMLADVDGDGLVDVLALTGDMAAHVFLGAIDSETGQYTVQPEASPPVAVPLETARREWAATPADFAKAPATWADLHGVQMHFFSKGEVRLALSMDLSATMVFYKWDAEHKRLVADYRGRSVLPPDPKVPPRVRKETVKLKLPGGEVPHETVIRTTNSWQTHSIWQTVGCHDADGQPDMLYAVVASNTLRADKEEARKRFGYVCWWAGGSQARYPDVLVKFPQQLPEVVHWTKGDPLSLRRVHVFQNGRRRDRWCVYFRPWEIGVFVERRQATDNVRK